MAQLSDKAKELSLGEVFGDVSKPLVLRPAHDADCPQLAEVHKACFGGPEAYVDYWKEEAFREIVRHSNQGSNCPFIVATRDDKIVGFIMVDYNSFYKPDRAYVASIDVDPSFQKHGIARLLLEAAQQEIIRARQFINTDTDITAHICVDNIASQRLFQSLGYAVTGVEKAYYPTGADAFIVSKNIPEATKPDYKQRHSHIKVKAPARPRV